MRASFFLVAIAVVTSVAATTTPPSSPPATPNAGGPTPVNITDATVQAVAKFVVASANTNQCGGKCSGILKGGNVTLVKINSATQTLAAGKMYKLCMQMVNTQAKKVSVKATVLYRPWLVANGTMDAAMKFVKVSFTFPKAR
ncbi:hypothetical protein Agub_g2483 [Astrephomene gubernaculifera]|uniref:Cystatin domain-containing protein n=1 Tax=Astrephomene gubernaculifera TaxID=47775 RepID=A0AAD3DKU9_9CHLO|nr:hypothetical protein Agub_g2483 [Astrephomene gubernaculifera]